MIQYIQFTVQLHGGEKGLNFKPTELKEALKQIILNAPNLNIEHSYPFEDNVMVDIDEVSLKHDFTFNIEDKNER